MENSEAARTVLGFLVGLGPLAIWRLLVWMETRPLPSYPHGRGWKLA